MNSPPRSRGRRYLADAARAFEQAPVEGVVAIILAVTFSYAVEVGEDALPIWASLLVACVLLLAGSWTGTLLYALGAWSARARWISTAVGAAAAGLYALLVPDLELLSEVWRAVLLGAAAALWILAVPLLAGPRAGAIDRVRDINGRFLLRVIGALLYTAALFAGLALALAAIDNLFELNLEGTIYAHVWGWLFLVLAPSIVVGGLREYARPIAPRPEVAGVIHRMTGFLVPPLLALYYGILYAYAIRMAVTGEVPKNLLSPMVLAAGVLGALTLYLFEPRPDDAGGKRYLRFVPPLFVPLAVLGAWAIVMRVDQYGWTEFRLVRLLALVVLGALAAGASIQLARRRRLALHIAPLVLALTLLLAAVGPWSVLTRARRSQQTRLAAVLQQAGAPATSTDTTRVPRTIPAELYDDLRSIAQYLAENFGPEALPPLLAAHATDRGAIYDLPQRIGLRRASPRGERGFRAAQLPSGSGVLVGAFTVHRVVVSEGRHPPTAGAATAALEATQLRIRNGTEVLWASLGGLIAVLASAPEPHGAIELSSEQARFDVTDSAGRRRGTLLIYSVNGVMEADRLKLNALDALLLLDG